jgi:ATP-dependent RNA helicase SUPV3L1/SUV3
MMSTIDMRDPAALYSSTTNKMNRKIIFHAGYVCYSLWYSPTNSGKTYHALNSLEKAESGVYCGPLRLLAHEIYERFNKDGVPCNLITGEDVRSDDAVLKYSCTIEMVPLAQSFDVCVIDEIQMIADSQRGWAWTKALLSVKAKEIHICGEPTAIGLVQKLCAQLGEEVEVREYTRLTPLTVEKHSLGGDESKIVKGDCFVAFSRNEIFLQKSLIEKKTGLRAAVIYGSLPPVCVRL